MNPGGVVRLRKYLTLAVLYSVLVAVFFVSYYSNLFFVMFPGDLKPETSRVWCADHSGQIDFHREPYENFLRPALRLHAAEVYHRSKPASDTDQPWSRGYPVPSAWWRLTLEDGIVLLAAPFWTFPLTMQR